MISKISANGSILQKISYLKSQNSTKNWIFLFFYVKIRKNNIVNQKNMHLKTKITFLKIASLSLIFALIIYFSIQKISNNVTEKTTTTTPAIQINNESWENNEKFKNAKNTQLWSIGVAITTNLGTRYSLKTTLPATIYKEVMSIEEVIGNNKLAQKELIGKNMQEIQEYRNILKTDVKQLINNSYDKRDILEAYIQQLEYRYTNGTQAVNTLLKQRETFNSSMTQANSQIETLKTKMWEDFSANNPDASIQNIDEYTSQKEKFYYAKAYGTYVNQFLTQYNFLNEYNKKLLDLLINNKEAIIKNAFVVVPDTSDIEALKSINLIFDENEVK